VTAPYGGSSHHRTEYDPIPVHIDHEGFEFVYWGKAATFYYWRDGRFIMWITRD
jgi:hypothetical protein